MQYINILFTYLQSYLSADAFLLRIMTQSLPFNYGDIFKDLKTIIIQYEIEINQTDMSKCRTCPLQPKLTANTKTILNQWRQPFTAVYDQQLALYKSRSINNFGQVPNFD